MAPEILTQALVIFAAPLGLLGHILGHLLACRLRPSLGILRAYFAGFPLGLLVFVAFEVFALGQRAALGDLVWTLLADLAAFLALSYTYFHFANMSYGARRIRLLRELSAHSKGLTTQELLARYSAREMLDSRIERLVASRQLRIEDGRLYNDQPAVRGMAACLALLKVVIFGGRQRSDLPQGIEALRKAIAEPPRGT